LLVWELMRQSKSNSEIWRDRILGVSYSLP
jgi:hypothetical protein